MSGTLCTVLCVFVKKWVSEFANGCKCFNIDASFDCGRVAQLGEHLLCKQGVAGSIPATSTNFCITSVVIASEPSSQFAPAVPYSTDSPRHHSQALALAAAPFHAPSMQRRRRR